MKWPPAGTPTVVSWSVDPLGAGTRSGAPWWVGKRDHGGTKHHPHQSRRPCAPRQKNHPKPSIPAPPPGWGVNVVPPSRFPHLVSTWDPGGGTPTPQQTQKCVSASGPKPRQKASGAERKHVAPRLVDPPRPRRWGPRTPPRGSTSRPATLGPHPQTRTPTTGNRTPRERRAGATPSGTTRGPGARRRTPRDPLYHPHQ